MLTREDLPERLTYKSHSQASRTALDAWFTAWALPASLYLGWIRSLHGAARRAR